MSCCGGWGSGGRKSTDPAISLFCKFLIKRKWKMFDCPPYPWAGIAPIQEIKIEIGHKDKSWAHPQSACLLLSDFDSISPPAPIRPPAYPSIILYSHPCIGPLVPNISSISQVPLHFQNKLYLWGSSQSNWLSSKKIVLAILLSESCSDSWTGSTGHGSITPVTTLTPCLLPSPWFMNC